MRTNKLAPNDQDLSSVLSEDAAYSPGLALSRQVNAVISFMQVAAHYGIKSPFQVEVFLRCAENQGAGLYDILGFTVDENPAEAKRFYAGLRQLMEGPGIRNYNGAKLLCWCDRLDGGNTNGRMRKIELTMKGNALRREIHRLLQGAIVCCRVGAKHRYSLMRVICKSSSAGYAGSSRLAYSSSSLFTDHARN